MSWPPKVGEPLPRASDAWCAPEKWVDWILAERGHASEWKRVLHIDPDQWEIAWETITAAVIGTPISTIRSSGPDGITCGVEVELWIGERTAAVMTSWHYADETAAPRLVTAYPRPYNRGHGNGS
jgi:hypothetical protein